MRFLVDVCLSREVASAVADAKGSCVHWLEIGPDDAKDLEIMQWCARHDHILVTADQDFGAILKHSGSHGPSVILLRTGDHAPTTVIPLLLGVFQRFDQELREGCLIAVDERTARIRRLPIE
jgi:predicted nuclease of predicted toxin-antitoxin system